VSGFQRGDKALHPRGCADEGNRGAEADDHTSKPLAELSPFPCEVQPDRPAVEHERDAERVAVPQRMDSTRSVGNIETERSELAAAVITTRTEDERAGCLCRKVKRDRPREITEDHSSDAESSDFADVLDSRRTPATIANDELEDLDALGLADAHRRERVFSADDHLSVRRVDEVRLTRLDRDSSPIANDAREQRPEARGSRDDARVDAEIDGNVSRRNGVGEHRRTIRPHAGAVA
jgi:hypothetical protein